MHSDYDINYQKRVFEEKESLDEKIVKLSYFMRLGIYEELSEAEKELLKNQLEVMTAYSNILAKRTELFVSGN